MIAKKELGQNKFDTAQETGEKVQGDTAMEGREMIRKDQRSLKESWEDYCDKLTETERRLENAIEQWDIYENEYDKFLMWLKDAEYKLTDEVQLKDTVEEKKAMLQNYRVYLNTGVCRNARTPGLNVIL